MKIIAISDTHNQHNKIPLKYLENTGCDVLIHAGDVSGMGSLTEIENFCKWYHGLDFPNKIFIAGNHDWGFQTKPKEVAEIISL